MQTQFDTFINRKGTSSIKWEFVVQNQALQSREMGDDPLADDQLLPMWVADMDFRSPQPVIDALAARVEHGLFGYSAPAEAYYEAIRGWMARRHGWQVEKEWILTAPGVVPALCLIIQAFSQPGEGIIIQTPVYHPFYHIIEDNDRIMVRNPLCLQRGSYEIDFADLEARVSDPNNTLLILCSPHNPVGRVWKADELGRIAQLCRQNGVLLVSDEIHHDLIYSWASFTSLGTVPNVDMDQVIVCTAPSKTFNIPGLKTSNVFIVNPALREQMKKQMGKQGLVGVNPLGLAALQTAYNQGEEWLDMTMAYIEENCLFLERFLAEKVPQIKLIWPEGTYLAWLDCRQLAAPGGETLHQLLMTQARVYLNDGKDFGEDGAGFMRLNLACSRLLLEMALNRIAQLVEKTVNS